MPQYSLYNPTSYGVIQLVPSAVNNVAFGRFIDPNAAPTPFPAQVKRKQSSTKQKRQSQQSAQNNRIVSAGGFIGPTSYNGAVPQEGQPGFVGPAMPEGGFIGPITQPIVQPEIYAMPPVVPPVMAAVQQGAQNWDNSGATGMPDEYDPPMFVPFIDLPQRGFLSYIQDVLNNYNGDDIY